jgi:hypothetical protein
MAKEDDESLDLNRVSTPYLEAEGLYQSPIRYFILDLDGKLLLPSLRLLLLVKDSALMLLLNLRLEVLGELPVVHLATLRQWGAGRRGLGLCLVALALLGREHVEN